jgi:hypothetical protein
MEVVWLSFVSNQELLSVRFGINLGILYDDGTYELCQKSRHKTDTCGNFAILFFCLVPRAVCFVSFAETNELLKKGIMYYVLAPNQFKG